MEPSNKYSPFRQAGFTLVEILVGLVIGLLATLVIMQVFTVFEGQKRTTTGTADAQTNGSTALFTIGRELQMAGYGLLPVTDSPLECTAPVIDAATGVGSISPVTINDGGAAAGASDSITIRYGTSPAGGIPTQITAIAGNAATVGNNLGCQTGDITLVTKGTACAISSATDATSATPTTITLANTTAAAVVVDANLACLGTWNEITYRANGNLERCDRVQAIANAGNCNLVTPNVNFIPNIIDIVNIQAQYGISAAANLNQVTQWVDASGATWAAPAVADRNHIKAVRIAVVARNGLLEKTNVTAACTTAKGTVNNGPCAWDDTSFDAAPRINLSNDPDWQRYRYRVFETIIPLRNVIWSKDTL